MKKHIFLSLIVMASALITSCGSSEKKKAIDNTPAIKVVVNQVGVNNNNPFLSVSGKIQAVHSADLSTRIMGYVNNVHVNVGDQVKKGTLLVSINNTDLQARRAQVYAGVTEATVNYKNAQKDYNRYKNLFTDDSATQKEMDDMTANLEMSKARLEAANQMLNEVKAQLEYSNITAPFNGTITSKNIKTGDMANPGVPLISMETPGNFEVMAMVPENEISEIKTGSQVDVFVNSINKTLKGIVSEVSTSARNTGGQYLVKIDLNKSDTKILSGMFSTIQFPVERKAKTAMVLIPTEAIITNGQLSGVYTVSQTQTAMLRWLRLGRAFGDQVEVLSGLNSDEAYIVSAEGKLYNGAKVSMQ